MVKYLLGSLVFFTLVCSTFVAAHNHEGFQIPEELSDVYNIHRPTQNHYSSGQPTREQLKEFAQRGVRNLINLRPPSETQDFNPAAWATEENIAYFTIPIAGGADLTPEHVALFHTIVERVEGEPTLIHCGSGNRVGAMMALRGVWEQGMEPEQAIELGKRYGLTSLESHVREQLAAQKL